MQVDIGMRMLVNAENYADVGRMMDVIDQAVRREIGAQADIYPKLKVHFDFTSFNTNPCKALALDRQAEAMYGDTPQPGPPDPGLAVEMATIDSERTSPGGMNVTAMIEDEF